MVTIAFVRCAVCTLGLIVSSTGQQVGQTDCWSLQQLSGVPSVLWELLSVQQGQRKGRQTVGHYSNFAVYRPYSGLILSAKDQQLMYTDFWSL